MCSTAGLLTSFQSIGFSAVQNILELTFIPLLAAPVLSVTADQVRGASSGSSTFEMSCKVTGQNMQNPSYSVLIRFEETAGGRSHKVLSLSADSILQLEEGMVPSRADSVALVKTGPLEYHFRLFGAQVSDRGFYYCDVTSWTRDQSNRWENRVSAQSNKIQLDFADTGINPANFIYI